MRTQIACTLIVIALAGCTDGESGRASIYVKDAPTDDWAEIHLVFTKSEITRSGEDNESAWVTLVDSSSGTDVDLLEAAGSKAAFLGSASLEPGRYSMVRITVSSAYGIDHAGARHNFTVSSGTVKAPGTFEVQEGNNTRIVLDFDLDRPGVLVSQGGTGWRMTPVIGTVTSEVVADNGDEPDTGEVVDAPA